MSVATAGLLAGIAFATGLNLYLTVGVIGVLARFGLLSELPGALQGLQSTLVIVSALVLYATETLAHRVQHLDSVWDAVHTLIRPPAAALLALGALWGRETHLLGAGAALALLVAMASHVTAGGIRMRRNATMHTSRRAALGLAQDAVAVTFTVGAIFTPVPTLAAVGGALVLTTLFAPRLWRAFRLAGRSIAAWIRGIFVPSGWRSYADLPRDVRRILDETPMGGAPPRGARATLHGLADVGPFRHGWLVTTSSGPSFIYPTLFGTRRIDLPEPHRFRAEPGVWTHILHAGAGTESYSLLVLKEGPAPEVLTQQLSQGAI